MSLDEDDKYIIDSSDIKKSLKDDFSLAGLKRLIRWILLLPIIGVVYFGIQTLAYALLIPYIQAFSDSLSDDFMSPLMMFILYPIGCFAIGIFSVYIALKIVPWIAPSQKVQSIRIIAGLIMLYAVSNILFTLSSSRSYSFESIFPVIAVSGSAGVTALFYAFSRNNAEMIIKTPNKALL